MLIKGRISNNDKNHSFTRFSYKPKKLLLSLPKDQCFRLNGHPDKLLFEIVNVDSISHDKDANLEQLGLLEFNN